MSSSSSKEEYVLHDVEKQELSKTQFDEVLEEEPVIVETTEVTKLSWVDHLASKLHAETKGIEPITDDEKDDDDILNAASMWLSANLVIAAFSLGCIGTSVFGLNFGEAVLVIVFFSFLGLLPVAFFSVFGAELGLRQLVLSRFLLGNVTARIFCFINIIAGVGWGAVNTIASASLLHIVNPSGPDCPPWAGCLIIIFGTIIVTFFGYRVIHAYEKWSWVPNFAVFLVIIARLAKAGTFTAGSWGSGSTTAGGVLSFGSSVFGFATGWTTYASDYTVYMPRTTNKKKVFAAIVLGLAFPLCFSMILGAAAVTGTRTNERWAELYDKYSVGGLCYAILIEDSLWGFGSFCCVVLALSTISNNIPNMYSIALGTQALFEPLAKVPRVAWTIIGNLVTLAIAIPAYYKFETFMTTFMDSIGYYLAIYSAIALSEHFIYRGGFKGYNVDDWDRWDKLPIGYAGTFALFIGAFGVAFGMNQIYWQGQIGRLIGENGGDIGFELGAGFAFITYNIFRPLEKKYVGR